MVGFFALAKQPRQFLDQKANYIDAESDAFGSGPSSGLGTPKESVLHICVKANVFQKNSESWPRQRRTCVQGASLGSPGHAPQPRTAATACQRHASPIERCATCSPRPACSLQHLYSKREVALLNIGKRTNAVSLLVFSSKIWDALRPTQVSWHV